MMRSAQIHGASGGQAAAIWLTAAAVCGTAVGLTTAWSLESALQAFGVMLVVIILAGVYAMPRSRTYDDRAIWAVFVVMLSLFSVYPFYISLRISGLPWISPVRLVLAVLLFMWVYALRVSPDMQARILAYIRVNRLFFGLFAIFTASQILGIPTSRQPEQALIRFAVFQLYWTFPFFAVLSLVHTGQRLQTFMILFIAFATIQCLVGFLEARQERLLWLDYLPPGFAADSEILQRILQGAFRAEGYRVQGSFSVSLLYAEFLVLMLPFALFAFIDGRGVAIRAIGFLTALAILPAQYLSGSRLGMVGSITVFVLLGVVYVVRVWRADRRSMVGPFLILLAPMGLVVFFAVFAASQRLKVMTFGGGAHLASTNSRLEMWAMSPPHILQRPLFGHGAGQGAEILGFANPAGIVTIDSYWLSTLLEFGLVGTFALLALLVLSVWTGLRTYLDMSNPNRHLGAPAALALIAFAIVKLVLSQVDNHLLVFVLMGIIIVAKGIGETVFAAPSLSHLGKVKLRRRTYRAVRPPRQVPVILTPNVRRTKKILYSMRIGAP